VNLAMRRPASRGSCSPSAASAAILVSNHTVLLSYCLSNAIIMMKKGYLSVRVFENGHYSCSTPVEKIIGADSDSE
jgi:hypothetical protein